MDTCAVAARNGHLGVLQWARVQNPPCEWDADTCASAADEEQWDVLRWLRAEADPPCSWYESTEAEAKAHFGEAEVASWGGPPAESDAEESDDDSD